MSNLTQSSNSSPESRQRRCSDGSIRSLRPKVPLKPQFINYQGQLHKMQRKNSKLDEKTNSHSSSMTTYPQETYACSEPQELNSPDHCRIAKKYGVSIATAKNYYSTLARPPNIPLIKIDGNNQDIKCFSQPIRSRSTSPILGSFRKRARSKAKQSSSALKGATVDNNACSNIQNYLSSLSIIKQENLSEGECEESLSSQPQCSQAPLKSWTSWPSAGSSDEFEFSKYSVSSKSKKSHEKNGELVMNHFYQRSNKTPKSSPVLNSRCRDKTPKSSPVFNSHSKSKTARKSQHSTSSSKSRTPKSSPVFDSHSKNKTPKSSTGLGYRDLTKTPSRFASSRGEKVTLYNNRNSPSASCEVTKVRKNGRELGSCKPRDAERCKKPSINSPKASQNLPHDRSLLWEALSDPTSKKQKIIGTFEIKKEEETGEPGDHGSLFVKNPVSSVSRKSDTNPFNMGCNKRSCCQSDHGNKTNIDSLSEAGSLADSTLVHFPPLFNPQEKVDPEVVINGNNSQGPILSFGDDLYKGHSNYDPEEELMDMLNPPIFSQPLVNRDAQENADEGDVMMSEENINQQDDEDLLEKIFGDDEYLDLMGPSDLDFLSSPRKDEAPKQSPNPGILRNDRNESRAKPMIVNDSILKTNRIRLDSSKGVVSYSDSLNPQSVPISPSHKLLNRHPTDLETSNLNQKVSTCNGLSQHLPDGVVTTLASPHTSVPHEPSINSPKSRDFPCTAEKNEPTNVNQATEENVVSDGSNTDFRTLVEPEDDSEETFEKICREICQLTDSESITLYKGDEAQPTEASSEKVTLHLAADDSDTHGSNAHNVVVNGQLESNQDNLSGKSPVTNVLINGHLELDQDDPSQKSPAPNEILNKQLERSQNDPAGKSPAPKVVMNEQLERSQDDPSRKSPAPKGMMDEQLERSQSNPSQKSPAPKVMMHQQLECSQDDSNRKSPALNLMMNGQLGHSRDNLGQKSPVPNVIVNGRLEHVEDDSGIKSPILSRKSLRLKRKTTPSPKSALNNLEQRDQQIDSFEKQKSSLHDADRDSSSISSPLPVLRDPRLNRSLSPTKQVSNPSRDPRLNKSSSCLNASIVDKGSNLMKGKSASFSASTSESAEGSNEEDLSKIVDPRLRKRKEREEAEKRAKLNASTNEVDENKSDVSKSSPDTPGSAKRSSVFDRLGAKKVKLTPSPDRSPSLDFDPSTEFVPNEFAHIIKARRRSTSINGDQDSGDELFFHPDDVFSSGEEEGEVTASPPHRKFTSERVDYVEPEPVAKKDMPGGYRKHNRWNESTRDSWNQGSDTKSRFSTNQNILNQNRPVYGQSYLQRPPLIQQHPIHTLRTPAQPPIHNLYQNNALLCHPLLAQPPPNFNPCIPFPAQIFPVPSPSIPQRPLVANQQTPAQTSSVHQRLTLPSQRVPTTVSTQPSNVHQRLTLPNSKLPAQPAVQKVPEPTPPVPPTRVARTFNPHAPPKKDGPDLSFSYYEMNNEQLRKDFENLEAQGDKGADKYITFDGDSDVPNKFDHVSILGDTVKPARLGSTDGTRTSFFQRACFRFLTNGKCMDTCKFSHEVTFLHKQLKQKRPELLYPILDFAIARRFEYFLTVTWSTVLEILQGDSFSIFEKLYEINIRGDQLIRDFLNFCLESKLHTPESFIKKISPIIALNDRNTVRSIWTAIKGELKQGFCWESVKDLCRKAVPPRDMIEITILECLDRKKNPTHIKEVYDLVEKRMPQEEKNKMSPNMLERFINLVKEKGLLVAKEEPVVNGTVKCVRTTKSPLALKNKPTDSAPQSEKQSPINTRPPSPILSRRKLSPIRAPQSIVKLPQSSYCSPRASKPQIVDQTSTNRLHQPLVSIQTKPAQQECSENLAESLRPRTSPLQDLGQQKPRPQAAAPAALDKRSQDLDYHMPDMIDNLEKPTSAIARERFKELYEALKIVEERLKEENYDGVWETLDGFAKGHPIADEYLRRAYYQVLCRDVKSSQRHILNVLSRAVRCDSSRQSKEILFEVGVCALIDLANADLWVMALELLKKIKILEPDEPDCTFVLVSTEIYLANNDPLEALDLLKRTRLLRTNRDEWRIKESTVYDEKHRNKLVLILMKSLSYVDQEKALWVFKELLKDQYICYFPIDLPLYMDELALLLLLFNKHELAAELSRIAMANDLTFKRSTYQELISRMLPHDEVLANQLLDYAMHLGYYNDIQIKNGHTYVIIDMNYVEEEIYMILKRLIRKLTLSVGPGVDRLKPNALKVILILEDIPDEKRLYRNDIAVLTHNKYKDIRNSINSMLSTRFSPPIRIASGKASKYCKLVSRTLVDYLKHWR